jgi:UDP-N-acetylmuramyl pentapeptide phosphotransferase/UDP-N-acetylglucosamine-1-phosphate transferase
VQRPCGGTVILISSAAAFAVTAASMPILIVIFTRHALVDSPNDRSMHTDPVPVGGGLACALGIAASSALLVATGYQILGSVLAVGFALGAIGFLDDMYSLGPFSRLIAQMLAGGIFGYALGGPLMAAVGVILLPLGVNSVNFMDGINGISGVSLIIWGIALSIAASGHSAAIVALGAAIAGVAAGFLVYNFPTAHVFLGDSGSYLLGALATAASIAAIASGGSPLLLIAPAAIYLVDVLSTLLRRAMHGANLFRAHREHLYQRLADRFGHVAVTIFIGSASALLVLAAWLLPAPIAAAAIVIVASGYLCIPVLVGVARGGMS